MKRFAMLACLALLLTAAPAAAQTPATDAHVHDFDFEFGPTWTAHLRLLRHRLVGAHDWVDFHGTLLTHKLWSGQGNMSELVVTNGKTNIVGGALHLYNPDTHQWSVWFANAITGTLGVPGVGHFANGEGVLYDREPYNGKMVYVRQIFSNMSAHTFNFDQAFSVDNGKTWETNLTIRYTR